MQVAPYPPPSAAQSDSRRDDLVDLVRAMASSRQSLIQEEHCDLPDADSLVYDVASMPGFRFQPTEEELVGFYLRSMVIGNRLEVELINVLDLYRYDPWELPAMAFMQGEREWLFFCPRDRKYPNGARPNRVTASGYWKATGTDRQVRRSFDSRCIGLKKTLVFYTGKAPRGRKTDWIMNEYRLPQNEQILRRFCARKDPREVALCRIYKKLPNLASQATGSTSTEDLGVESSTTYPWEDCSHLHQDQGALESEQASASTSGTSARSRLSSCRRSNFHEELCPDTEVSCRRAVKLESESTLASLRANLAPDNIEETMAALRQAKLMQAESRQRRSIVERPAPSETRTTATTRTATSMDVEVSESVSADRFSSLGPEDCCTNLSLPSDVCNFYDQVPVSSNLTPMSNASCIDRLLKSSMFSPNKSTSMLADDYEADQPQPPALYSNYLGGWSTHHPTWLQTISPNRPSVMQLDGPSFLHSYEMY